MNPLKDYTDDQLFEELDRRKNKVVKSLVNRCEELEDEVRRLSVLLRQAELGKTEFLSNVRNEINNPLTAILGLSENLAKTSHDEKLARLSRFIHSNVFELDFQMRNIIAAAEIESGESQLVASHVNIQSLLEAQTNYLEPRLKPYSKKIEFASSSPKLSFVTDPSVLQTVVTNLLANAIEFSHVGGTVSVRYSIENGQLLLMVKDVGIGIDPVMKERIFERFHQLDKGVTKRHRGQGLGLAIVNELVSILNGTIDIESIPSLGTTVKLVIPEMTSTPSLAGSSSFGNETMFYEGEEF